MGISYSPMQSGAFALLLAEENGPYRIPVVIGSSEAQSIAIQLEHIVTPRPITHDLFTSFSHAFGVELQEVFIYKFEDGIFSSELTFTDGCREVKLDSRTSDAIAIAIRMNAPIYTTRDILMRTGAILRKEEGTNNLVLEDAQGGSDEAPVEYDKMSAEELKAALDKMIEEENYEEAAKLNSLLKKLDEDDDIPKFDL